MPKFSVIIPVYNKLPHLDRSINSVLKQTFEDFELIIINDASSDGSETKILEYSDSRISILNRETPGPGGYAARNLGISLSKGKYIAFLDADDEWTLNHLSKMDCLTRQYPETYFFTCGWETKDNNCVHPNSFYSKKKAYGSIILNYEEYFKYKLKKVNIECTIVACIKKSSPVLKDLFPVDPKIRRSGDSYAWLKLICHHKEVAWSNHIGAIYYRDSVNMVTKNNDANIDIFSNNSLSFLSGELNKSEQKLLKKYFNLKIRSSFVELNYGFNLVNLYTSLFKLPLTSFLYNYTYVIAARIKHSLIRKVNN